MEIGEICSLCDLFSLYLLKIMYLIKKKALHRISLTVNLHMKHKEIISTIC